MYAMRATGYYKKALSRYGSVQINLPDSPVPERWWSELEKLLSPVFLDFKTSSYPAGTDGVLVARIPVVSDGRKETASSPHASRVSELIAADDFLSFLRAVIGRDVRIKRCQAHIIREGTAIATHVDTATDPTFSHPVVLQFEEPIAGGVYTVHHPYLGPQQFRLPRFSILVSSGELPHEVSAVERGRRTTVVVFLGSE